MPRRHLLGIAAAAVGVALTAAACTIPTTNDGGGYGPKRLGGAGVDAVGVTVNLRSGARQKLAGQNSSWNPARYVAAPGARIVLDVVNDDPTQHNFTLLRVGYGVTWVLELWLGSVVWASLSGLTLAVLMQPAAVPLTAWNRRRLPAPAAAPAPAALPDHAPALER